MAGGLLGFIQRIPSDIEGEVSKVVGGNKAAPVAAPPKLRSNLLQPVAPAPQVPQQMRAPQAINSSTNKDPWNLDSAIKAVQGAAKAGLQDTNAIDSATRNYAVGAVKGLSKTAFDLAGGQRVANDQKAVTAKATGNKVALANAEKANKNAPNVQAQAGADLVHGLVTDPAAQLYESGRQAVDKVGGHDNSGVITPHGTLENDLLGQGKIQSLQTGNASARSNPAIKGIPDWQKDVVGGAYTAGQLLQDAPVGAKAAELAHEGSAAVVRGGAKAALAAAPHLDAAVKAVQAANEALGESGKLSGTDVPSESTPSKEPTPLQPTEANHEAGQEPKPLSPGQPEQTPLSSTAEHTAPSESGKESNVSSDNPNTEPPKSQSPFVVPKARDSMFIKRMKADQPYSYADYKADAKAAGAENIQSNEDFKRSNYDGRHQVLRDAQANTDANPVKFEKADAGKNYQQIKNLPRALSARLTSLGRISSDAIKNLSPEDNANFNHYVEGKMNVNDAKDPEAVRDAVEKHNNLANNIHASSQGLGGNTNYLGGRTSDLGLPADYVKHSFEHDPDPEEEESNFTKSNNTKFKGVDSNNRIVNSYKEGEAFGLKPKYAKPEDAETAYTQQSASRLHDEYMKQLLSEAQKADGTKSSGRTVTLNGKKFDLSEEAAKHMKNLWDENKPDLPEVLTKVQGPLKKLLLSLSQYHPTNINVLQAAPALALSGHPLMALKGVFDTFASIHPAYAKMLRDGADAEGIPEKAATIGSPIGQDSFEDPEGEKAPSDMIFQRQLPAMHYQMVRAAIKDMEARNISLDSPEAAALGDSINHIMGFLGDANISKAVMRRLGDFLLAPQFEMSKLLMVRDMFKSGLAGKYARNAILGKYATEVGLQTAIGAATNQKSNNLQDQLIQTVFNPQAATGLKSGNGDNAAIKLPDSGASEVASIFAHPERGSDGRLAVKPNGPGDAYNQVTKDLSQKTAPLPATIERLTTNQNYEGNPVRDTTAPLSTQIAEGAAGTIPDLLPIGLQGAAYTKPVEDAVGKLSPQAEQVLQKDSPGGNPLLRSLATTFAASPVNDSTTGQGLQAKQHFANQDANTAGLTPKELDAFNLQFASSKNPVTGEYDQTNKNTNLANLGPDNADNMLTYPKAFQAAVKTAKQDAANGQAVDPVYTKLTPNQQQAYLKYERDATSGQDRIDWLNKSTDGVLNSTWYNKLTAEQNTYFNSLPKGDPNKPSDNIKYPTPLPQVAALQTAYNNIPTAANYSDARANFLNAHPELVDQWSAQSAYDNKIRVAQGYTPLKVAPQATPAIQSYINTYDAADKATRSSMRTADPNAYQTMVAYYDNNDLSTINKAGAVDELQGEPDASQAELKAISGLAPDIYSNGSAAAPLNVVPAGWMNGLTALDSSGSGSSSSSSTPIPGDGPYSALKGLTNPLLNTDRNETKQSFPGESSKGLPTGKNKYSSTKATTKVSKVTKVRLARPASSGKGMKSPTHVRQVYTKVKRSHL